MVTYTKVSPKVVKPRDLVGNAEEEEGNATNAGIVINTTNVTSPGPATDTGNVTNAL